MNSVGFGAYYYRHENKWLSIGTTSNFLVTFEDDILTFKSSKQIEESEEIDFKTSLVINEEGYLTSGIGFKRNITRISKPSDFLLDESYNDCHIIFDVGTTIILPSENISVGFHCWLFKNDLLSDENFIDRVIIDIEANEDKNISIRTGNKIHELGVIEEAKWASHIGNMRPTLISGKEIFLIKIHEGREDIWLLNFGFIDEDILYK